MLRIQSIFKNILPLFILVFSSTAVIAQQDFNSPTAKYRVTFHATWNQFDHPVDFPNFDHFSGLIGMTHNQNIDLFVEGQLATPGVIQMAETGAKTTLINEITQHIANGTAKAVLSGNGLNTGTGMVSLEFEIDQTHPLVSITSMIAPSADWFIGVNSLQMIDENGDFRPLITIDLNLYDSGTDGGTRYTSADADIPRSPIDLVNSFPLDSDFQGGQPFVGQLTLELIQ